MAPCSGIAAEREEKAMDDPALKSCADFTGALASKAPTPGGGGAAALTGELCAALCAMAARLTLGKKKVAAAEGEVFQIAERAEALRRCFLALMAGDEAAFAPLSRVYAMEKTAPGYEATRRAASLAACLPPLEMLRRCGEVLPLLERMYAIGNPMLMSDVGCAAALCAGAMRAASMNVYVNTRSLKGDGEADRINRETGALLKEFVPRAEKLSAAVTEYLEG